MKYFDRWYEQEDRERKAFKATRPDILSSPDLKGLSSDQASPLLDTAQTQVGEMIDGMVEAASEDWQTYLPVSMPIDLQWIDEFDKYYGKAQIKALMRRSKPSDFSNDFLVTCCEFGAVLGQVFLATQPNLYWLYDLPYWESSIFDPKTGSVIPVFHWAIKKLSSYGIDDGCKAKLLHCADIIRQERKS